MLLTKIITTTIEFSPIDWNVIDIDAVIMNKLNEKFVGKCFSSVYIKSINGIIEKSLIRASSVRNDGYMYCNIRFEVTCIYYFHGELILGIQIQHNSTADGSLICNFKYGSVNISGDEHLSDFSKDDIIACFVDLASYPPFQKISILGRSFTPTLKKNIYYIVENNEKIEINESLKNIYNDVMKKFNDIKNNEKHAKSIEFFINLLYPYKKVKEYEGPIKLTKININEKEFNKFNGGIFLRPSNIEIDKEQCYYAEFSAENVATITKSYNFVKLKMTRLFEILISELCLEMNSLCEMIEYYNDTNKTTDKYTKSLKYYKYNKLD